MLDGKVEQTNGGVCDEYFLGRINPNVVNIEKVYSFKTISGAILEHKSPTDEEYGAALKEMVTPSLPSDRDRYVDYLDKQQKYQKIVYPNFFRIVLDGRELNYP